MKESFPALPDLIALELPEQYLALDDFAHIARRAPKLCHLHSNLLEPGNEIPNIEHHGTAPLHSIQRVRPLEERLIVQNPEKVPR
ncbi:hypothetical protein FRC07_006504, partial [Ceratobasidium sp. 392]